MLCKEVQCAKAPSPIWVTESGRVMLFKEVQPSKALLPISVAESGMVMLCKEVQCAKAPLPIRVTESGMVTRSKEAQPMKAISPITELGMVTFTSGWQYRKAPVVNPRHSLRDVHLAKFFCMNLLLRCSFNFVSSVDDCHFRFLMQPWFIQCLSIL